MIHIIASEGHYAPTNEEWRSIAFLAERSALLVADEGEFLGDQAGDILRAVAEAISLVASTEWQLIHTDDKVKGSLQTMVDVLSLELKEGGGCDHDVNICECHLIGALANVQHVLNHMNGKGHHHEENLLQSLSGDPT